MNHLIFKARFRLNHDQRNFMIHKSIDVLKRNFVRIKVMRGIGRGDVGTEGTNKYF